MERPFDDRRDAGRHLAPAVAELDLDDPVVLGLPRGGVPVAAEVAAALAAPLDVLVVRKIGVPGHEELGIGAIGEDEAVVVDRDRLRQLGLDDDDLRPTVEREGRELARRVERYRGGHPGIPLADRTVVAVDDGVATGVSAQVAIEVLRARRPGRVVFATPVAAPQSLDRLAGVVDDLVTLRAPHGFLAVGQFYRDFGQTSDDEVIACLQAAAGPVQR